LYEKSIKKARRDDGERCWGTPLSINYISVRITVITLFIETFHSFRDNKLRSISSDKGGRQETLKHIDNAVSVKFSIKYVRHLLKRSMPFRLIFIISMHHGFCDILIKQSTFQSSTICDMLSIHLVFSISIHEADNEKRQRGGVVHAARRYARGEVKRNGRGVARAGRIGAREKRERERSGGR